MGYISLYDFYSKIIPINEFIIQASEVSGQGKNEYTRYSIGLNFNILYLSNRQKLNIQLGNHQYLILCCFNYDTDKRRRGADKINRRVIHNNLFKNDIKNCKIPYINYINMLSKYKFIISPEGNGIDCHRHYEAILCGCIPIIEYNKDIEKKYEELPVLYTKDYSEITPQYLNQIYKKMLFKRYNYSKIMLSYYSQNERNEIREKGNYWCNFFLNKNAYT